MAGEKVRIVAVMVVAVVALLNVASGAEMDTCEVTCEKIDPSINLDCHAKYGAIPRLDYRINQLIREQFDTSMQYLLISRYFSAWRFQRPGFASYFSKLSDEHWEEGMSLLTYFMERGGSLDDNFVLDMKDVSLTSEVQALANALEMEKRVANRTLQLGHQAIHIPAVYKGYFETVSTTPGTAPGTPKAGEKHDVELHDVALANFLAEKLHHNQLLRIKHLANYVNLLKDILHQGTDNAYVLFKFDSDYLK